MVPGARQGSGGPALSLSEEFQRMASLCGGDSVTFRMLLPHMSARDHALLTLLLSMCFLHPVPMLGLSMIFGGVIMIAGVRMAAGLGIWIPERWVDRPMPSRLMGKVFSAGHWVMKRLEKVVRPRGRNWAGHPWVRVLNGAAIAGCGVLISIPLPPPTNFPPAAALLLLSIGVLEDDALFLGFGYAAFALNVVLFGLIAVLGFDGIKRLL